MTVLPYYKRYPAKFLRGIQNMTSEQIAVYCVLLEVMYDAWAPVEDRTPKQRRDLAAMCGLSVRKFGTTVDELLSLGKLERHLSGRLSNRKFELLAKDRGIDTASTSQKNGKNMLDDRVDNRGDNEGGLNDPNGLDPPNTLETRARANLELRTKNSDSVPAPDRVLSKEAEKIVESEISQICRAIGVNLQSSTHRFLWPARWVEMRQRYGITLEDMLAAINSYGTQFKGEQVRSLGMYRARAIEKKTMRLLSTRIASISGASDAERWASVPRDEWRDALTLFIRLGAWDSTKLGPSPLEPGCKVPADMLANAESYWIKNGNHPEAMHHGGARKAWAPGKTGPVLQATPFFKTKSET